MACEGEVPSVMSAAPSQRPSHGSLDLGPQIRGRDVHQRDEIAQERLPVTGAGTASLSWLQEEAPPRWSRPSLLSPKATSENMSRRTREDYAVRKELESLEDKMMRQVLRLQEQSERFMDIMMHPLEAKVAALEGRQPEIACSIAELRGNLKGIQDSMEIQVRRNNQTETRMCNMRKTLEEELQSRMGEVTNRLGEGPAPSDTVSRSEMVELAKVLKKELKKLVEESFQDGRVVSRKELGDLGSSLREELAAVEKLTAETAATKLQGHQELTAAAEAVRGEMKILTEKAIQEEALVRASMSAVQDLEKASDRAKVSLEALDRRMARCEHDLKDLRTTARAPTPISSAREGEAAASMEQHELLMQRVARCERLEEDLRFDVDSHRNLLRSLEETQRQLQCRRDAEQKDGASELTKQMTQCEAQIQELQQQLSLQLTTSSESQAEPLVDLASERLEKCERFQQDVQKQIARCAEQVEVMGQQLRDQVTEPQHFTERLEQVTLRLQQDFRQELSALKTQQAPGKASPLVVKSYGILGRSNVEQKADLPQEDTILVDPAGLPFIQGGPRDAKGAAQANYQWLEISEAESFPPEVKRTITEEGQAKYYAYADGKKKCIHVVGPDFRNKNLTLDQAVEKLAIAYSNVFEEFCAVGLGKMRLLPISGGIFSGPFKEDLPEMTARAVHFAYENLSEEKKQRIMKSSIEMCIFMESEFPLFASAFGQADSVLSESVRAQIGRCEKRLEDLKQELHEKLAEPSQASSLVKNHENEEVDLTDHQLMLLDLQQRVLTLEGGDVVLPSSKSEEVLGQAAEIMQKLELDLQQARQAVVPGLEAMTGGEHGHAALPEVHPGHPLPSLPPVAAMKVLASPRLQRLSMTPRLQEVAAQRVEAAASRVAFTPEESETPQHASAELRAEVAAVWDAIAELAEIVGDAAPQGAVRYADASSLGDLVKAVQDAQDAKDKAAQCERSIESTGNDVRRVEAALQELDSRMFGCERKLALNVDSKEEMFATFDMSSFKMGQERPKADPAETAPSRVARAFGSAVAHRVSEVSSATVSDAGLVEDFVGQIGPGDPRDDLSQVSEHAKAALDG